MDFDERHFSFDDETDRIFSDDETEIFPERSPRSYMDEDEARAYSSVYDIPITSSIKKHKPKH